MKRTFTFRIEDVLWDKFHYLAACDKRSVNMMLEILVEKAVKDFERENGEIPKHDEQ